MAYVQFYDSLPSGYRLSDLFISPASGLSLTASVTPNLASFEIASSRGRVPVTYYGSHLAPDQGSVSAIAFGTASNPWIAYGSASDPLARFSYAGGLAAFHRSGVSAAAIVMAGADFLLGSSKDDYLEGYGGNDTINGGRGADTMVGSIGDDLYYANDSQDRAFEYFDGGLDTLIASVNYTLAKSTHVEVLQAASGRSSLALTGNSYANAIIGNSGSNILSGGGGLDTLAGGAGDDTYLIGSNRTVIVENAKEGFDTVLARINYALTGGSAVEDLIADGKRALHLTGNDLKNTITGNDASNVLQGMGGNDTLYGGNGRDVLRGGADRDALYGGNGTDRLYGESGNDTLYGGADSGTLSGGSDNDLLYGSWGNDTLKGDDGNDRLFGDTGNDVLFGGAGKDRLASGEGYDRFVFDAPLNARSNVDTLVDFNPWADQIRLKFSIFSRIGGTGALDEDRFWSGAKAHDRDDRIIYDKGAGPLYYDRDGTGAAPQIKFALVGKVELSAAAFLIF